MYQLEIRHKFDASHQLKDSALLISKGCARLHGHTYAVRVFISVEKLNDADMVIDFKAIKNAIDVLDHRHINDVFSDTGWGEYQPTAERIAEYIAEMLYNRFGFNAKVMLCEGYRGDEFSSWATYQLDEKK